MRNKIRLISLWLIINPLLTFADSPPPTNSDSITSVSYICQSIGDLLCIPLDALQSFLSNNGHAAAVAYTLFAIFFILETLWQVAKAYLQSQHQAGQNIAVLILVRMITGTLLLMFVNVSVGRSPTEIGMVSGSGANGLVNAIFAFFMDIGNSFGGSSGTINLFPGGSISSGSYNNIISTEFLTPVGNMCDAYLTQYFDLTKNMTGDTFGIIGAFYRFFAIIAVIIAVVFVTMIAWGLVFKIAEMIIVTQTTVYMVGFIGSEWTKSYFDRYLSYIIALAIEFFVLVILLNFIIAKMLMINQDVTSVDLWGPIKLVFNTIISYQLVALTPKISAAISSGTPTISTGDSAMAMKGATVGAAAAGMGMVGGAAGSLQTAGGLAKAGMQIASGGVSGAISGAVSGGMGGGGGIGSSIKGGVLGALHGAKNAATEAGGAIDSVKSTPLTSAVKSLGEAGKALTKNQDGTTPSGIMEQASNAVKNLANVTGGGLSKAHSGPAEGGPNKNVSRLNQ